MIDITGNFASFLPSVLAIAAIAFVAFVVITIIRAVRTVPQGEEWTVERFGRYSRTLEPGLRFMVPLIDQVGRQINMMETVLDIDGQDVITRDNAQVRADATECDREIGRDAIWQVRPDASRCKPP
ncbi:MAG: SPFH domain-containing protein, partial [Pseudomonadota bacterium]